MSPLLEQQLVCKHPGLFAKMDDKSEPRNCMSFGISCGDGWFRILDVLFVTLSTGYSGTCATLEDPKQTFRYEFPAVVLDQVKEKFGTLRVYYHLEMDEHFDEQAKKYPQTARSVVSDLTQYVNGAIAMAEALSAVTCEDTGAPGVMMSRGGWYRTMSLEDGKKQGFSPIP